MRPPSSRAARIALGATLGILTIWLLLIGAAVTIQLVWWWLT